MFWLTTNAQSGRRKSSAENNSPAPPRKPAILPVKKSPGQDSSNPIRSGKETTPTPGAEQERPSVLQQRDKTMSDDVDTVVRVTSNLVPLQASVVNAQGQTVTTLTLNDFELHVDGEPQTISALSHAETPVRLALLFDNSTSLNLAREFEKKAAIKFFRRVLRPVDQAAIFSITTVPVLEQPLTDNVNQLVRTIENFGKPRGATAMLDTIIRAAQYLRVMSGRKVIVIVSDGADTVSEQDFATTLRLAQAANCQIYVVQTGQSANANLRDLTADRRLQELTAQTGGAMYVPLQNADLDAAFTQISAELAQQYVLSYYPSNEKRDGRFHTVSLSVRADPKASVRTRKGYYSKSER